MGGIPRRPRDASRLGRIPADGYDLDFGHCRAEIHETFSATLQRHRKRGAMKCDLCGEDIDLKWEPLGFYANSHFFCILEEDAPEPKMSKFPMDHNPHTNS